MSIDLDGVDTATGGGPGDFEGTPLPSSPRVLAAQQTAAEAASAVQKAESVSVCVCVRSVCVSVAVWFKLVYSSMLGVELS